MFFLELAAEVVVFGEFGEVLALELHEFGFAGLAFAAAFVGGARLLVEAARAFDG